jgi:DNA invertase Pin-like site-specific DNA recombinase
MRTKITASHLERRAYVYVRQSTTSQVFQHAESTRRQYALVERAAALGWPRAAIEVIDEDQGRSGASSEGRTGFARLVDAIAHGSVGAVLAVEVSRLARSSPDWQRMLALCAVAETVVIDEQVIYDPADRDDKLLLDIKGTMSEAELHWLGLRLTGALRSKARRGELRVPIPTGYVWTERGLCFDPDEAVQRAVRLVFERYAVETSVLALVRWANTNRFLIPTRRWYSDGTSQLQWTQLVAQRVSEMLKNPVYAGVYVYGRRPTRKVLVDGEIRKVRDAGRDPDKWAVRIDDAHPAYITWESYVSNQKKLRENQLHESKRGAPHGGPALLNGLLVCGRCGLRMYAQYGSKRTRRAYYAYYHCRGDHGYGEKQCWSVVAEPLDRAVEELFLKSMVPAELEVSLAVESEVMVQSEGLDRHWKLRIEQARYEAQRAERRYMAVDPDNRVVARTLERDWEERLVQLEQLERQRDEARRQHVVQLSPEDRAKIRALARDLPRVWRAKTTLQSERKAMLQLVIEAISLTPIDIPQRATRVRVSWKSGAVSELCIERPEHGRLTTQVATQRVRELCALKLHDPEIAERLNAEGLHTGASLAWTADAVARVRGRERLACTPLPTARPSVPDRDKRGRFSVVGAARHFGVSLHVVREWVYQKRVKVSRESYKSHRDVLWLTIGPATERRLWEHLKRTADRYPRLVPPPPITAHAEARATEKDVS